MANEGLMHAPDNDTETGVTLDMTGYEFSSGLSSYIPPGIYACTIKACAWRDKKSGPGKNLMVQFVVEEPTAQKGAKLVAYHAAPVGSPGESSYDTGVRFVSALFASVLANLGKLEDAKAKGVCTFSPRVVIGRRCYVRVGDGEYRGRRVTQVDGYVGPKEFADAPGPDLSAPPPPPPQHTEKEPDLLGGAGSGGGNGGAGRADAATASKSPVDDMLGL